MLRRIDARAGEPLPGPAPIALDPAVLEGVRAILARVRDEGDAALVELTRTYDGADVAGRLAIGPDALAAARDAVAPGLRTTIEATAERLRDLHARQLPRPWEAERDGVVYGETVRPVRAAGCYVPGGRASYPSTVLMTAVPARVAGVERVAVATPPRADGSIPPAVLYAAHVAGVDAVHPVGGAQAIGALAFGTASVPRVDVIVGPGNVWVTAAKREVQGLVGIDGLAGPSELAVVADKTADPAHVAVDLLAQAEHDPLARAVLITTDPDLPDRIEPHLAREVAASPRREIVEPALGLAAAVVVADEDAAAEAVDRLAPEHLQVLTVDPRAFLARVRCYGAAFLGPNTPVTFGDYGVGSNHVLPTMGTARFASGLRADVFVTVSSYTIASRGAARRLGPGVEALARAEGLDGHARASEIRRA